MPFLRFREKTFRVDNRVHTRRLFPVLGWGQVLCYVWERDHVIEGLDSAHNPALRTRKAKGSCVARARKDLASIIGKNLQKRIFEEKIDT